MAKKKSESTRAKPCVITWSAQPDAMPKDVIAALAKEGIKVSRILVSTDQGASSKRPARQEGGEETGSSVVAAPAAPAAVEKPTNGGGTITLDQVKKVAQTIKTLGGFQRMTEVLAVIKELGGVKKFKDLAEAMTVTETAARQRTPFRSDRNLN